MLMAASQHYKDQVIIKNLNVNYVVLKHKINCK